MGEACVSCAFVEVEGTSSKGSGCRELSWEEVSLEEVICTPVCPLGELAGNPTELGNNLFPETGTFPAPRILQEPCRQLGSIYGAAVKCPAIDT